MKRLLKPVNTNTEARSPNKCMFTPADVQDFLLQIDELSGYDISFEKTPDGSVEYLIGNSVYHIEDITQ